MKTLLFLLLSVFLLMVALNLLEAVTRRCRRRLAEYEASRPSPPAAAPPSGAEPDAGAHDTTEPATGVGFVADPEQPPVPSEGADASRRRLREAVLGLLFVPVLVVFVVLNSSILAEAFSLLLDRAGSVVGTIAAGSLQIEITDLHLYGLALSSALILLGAACAACRESGSAWVWFVLIAGVVPLVGLEVWLSAQRGYLLAVEGNAHPLVTPPALAIYNGLMGAVCAITEVVAGYYVFHALAVPFAAGTIWGVIAPVRWLWRAGAEALQRAAAGRRAAGRPSVVTRALAYIDESWMEPLRDLDRAGARLLARMRTRREGANA